MGRPTVLLRRMLVLEALHKYIVCELAALKEQMRDESVKIIERYDATHEIRFEYVEGNKHQEAIYIRKMLDAEVKNRAKRCGLNVLD